MRGTRWAAWLPVLVFLGTALIYSATISRLPSYDATTANMVSWNIANTGSPDVRLTDFPGFNGLSTRGGWLVHDAHGHEMIGRAPGVIAASIPAYLLAGRGAFSVVPGALTAALLTAAAMAWLFWLLDRLVPTRVALQAVLVLGFTTPVWTVAADALWPQSLTLLGMVGMAVCARSDRWWLVGFWGGFAATGRLHVAIVCLVLAVGCSWQRRRWAPMLQAGAVGLLWLGTISLWTHWMYGKWDPTSGYVASRFVDYATGHRFDVVNLLGFLISPHRGLLVWTPVLLLLLPALVRGWRNLPDWTRWLAVGGGLYLLVQGMLNRFSGGFFFYGYRLPLEALVCLTPALVLSRDHCRRVARALFGPLVILQGALVIPGALTDLYTPPVDSWTTNALWYWFTRKPAAIAGLVLASGLMTALAVRLAGARTVTEPAEPEPQRVESGP